LNGFFSASGSLAKRREEKNEGNEDAFVLVEEKT
jgi:hypothetical protein